MKTLIKNLTPVLILAVAVVLAAFSFRPGAHSFQVFVDDNMVIDRYVNRDMIPQTIQLGKDAKKIDVRYNECGRTVTSRSLTAKDKTGKVLKVWKFDGETSGLKDAMTLQVSDIRSVAGNGEARIFYGSNEFNEGLHIFTAAVGNATVASGN